MKISTVQIPLFFSLAILLGACAKEPESAAPAASPPPMAAEPSLPDAGGEQTQAVALLRGLPTLDTTHSVAIIELDPESDQFGKILHEFETPDMVLPLHHLYYSPTGRLYASGLDPACSLAEVRLSRDVSGSPKIDGVDCLDTGGQQVGEDIMWHSVDGIRYMFVSGSE